MYRLHIDIPLPYSEQEAIDIGNKIIAIIGNQDTISNLNIYQINYRLGHDDDRQKSNYMMKNENGHVNNKKCKIELLKQEADACNQQYKESIDGE